MLTAIPADEARWAAVVARDREADGTFWYSVRTTGVYCRPSCAARLARRENVAFHASRAEAEAAGFRPCKRCKPDQPALAERHAELIAEACRALASDEPPPRLDALGARTGLSPYHFHRLFKAATGLTPAAYARAARADRVRRALPAAGSVTEAIYEAGFNSGGRFYETSAQALGMAPARFRQGGAAETIRFAVGQCSLGAILAAETDRGVCAILLGDDPADLVCDLQDRFPRADLVGGDLEFEARMARIVGLVEAPGLALDLPLDIRGTAFQQRVWTALSQIRPGQTASYADIARRIGQPSAVRAVAQACAANALAIAIPCHRVVRNDGALSGYRWGIERKAALLAREAAA